MNLKNDLLASVVVFLVALPLCMGVAIASGAPPENAAAIGIITGIVGGIVVGSLGGCPLQVSGPAAGLAVLVGELVGHHGYEKLGLIVIVAGAAQLLSGLLRAGQWFRAISPAVIQGMLAGIGVLIFAGQFHVMFDRSPPGTGKEYGGLINLQGMPETLRAVWENSALQPAAVIGVVTIATILLWTFLSPKKLKFLPPSLIAVLLAVIVAATFHFSLKYINVPNNLSSAIAMPTSATLPELLTWPIIKAGLVLAFVASAESLLTAAAADTMQQHAPRTNYDRELAAQGIGNLTCGLLGGLPITGVIVRTSANIQAGGQTRLSTILHGGWLLLFAVGFPSLLRMIPVSCLAAILVYTGYKLVNVKAIQTLAKYGKGELLVYFTTMICVVGVDLLFGIVVGMGIVLARLIYTLSHLKIDTVHDTANNRTTIYLEGSATFIRLPDLAKALQQVPASTELHVDFDHLSHIDHACLDLIMNWEKQHKNSGGKLVLDWEHLSGRFYAPQLGRREANVAGKQTQEPSA